MRVPLCAAVLALAGCESSPSRPKAAALDPAPVATVDASVAVVPDPKPLKVTPPAADAVVALARGSNTFGFELYAKLRGKPGNLVVSPSSITTALTMTWGGARGETAKQMQKVLHLDGAPAQVMTVAGTLARSLEDPSRPVVFRIANQLFGEKSYTFEEVFVEQTETAFGAPMEMLDFRTAPGPAREKINAWVESRTEKRIVDLLPPDGIDSETRLVLVNAIYFLGEWAEPFESTRTQPAPFFVAKATQKQVPAMNATEQFRYAHANGLAALELPYKGGSMSMLIVVPDAVDGLPALERSFDAGKLDALVSSLKPERVWLQLPKFEIAPAQSLSLGDQLVALGMPLAFDRKRADFTGIANPTNPEDRLVIAKVFHKAFIKVDEKGTEAAAATAVSMARAGGAPAKPTELKADRPFLYFIRDTASGLVLFMGRVSDPSVK
ncbi:MAG: serpin family protein [Kofleriaceae bacterium]